MSVPPYDPALVPGAPTAEERSWAMAAHLASLANLVVPFGALLGPVVVWVSKKNESAFVDRRGKESIQFQASFLAYHMVLMCGGVASFVGVLVLAEAGGARGPAEVLGPLAMIALFGLGGIAILLRLFVMVTMIIAAVRANAGEEFRYPLTIRLMK